MGQGGRNAAGAASWLRAPAARAVVALVLIVALGVVFHADGAFFKWGTHRDVLRYIAVYGILACGLTVVIVSGGIDLSVGSVLGLTAVLFSRFSIQWGWPAYAAIPLCLAAGAALGGLSGACIARFQMQPFITTLAMMVFARGLAKYVSGGQKVSTSVQLPDGTYQYVELPRVFELLDTRILSGNLSVITVILLVCVAACWVVLARMRIGRQIYAIGGNETAARLSGVPVGRAKVLAYGLSGLFAAVAGICQAAQETQGDPEAGATYELTAIAMVVIGGTSLTGGQGGMLLTLLGMLTIGYLDKILSINAVGEASRLMLTGGIIVGAVMFQRTRRN